MATTNPRIKAGISGAAIRFVLKTRTGAVMDDADVTALEYQVDDVTNASVITARTDVGVLVAEGEVPLSAVETALNGSGTEETRRLTLWVNTDADFSDILFKVYDADRSL